LWLLKECEIRALAADDKETAGWRAYQSGWIYYLRSQSVETLSCASRAADYWQKSKPRNKATAISLRGLGHRLAKEYPAAIAAHREALEIKRSIAPDSEDVASELNWLAGTEHLNNDYIAAERDYRQALRIAKIVNDDEGIAIYTGNLAAVTLDQEQGTEAESLAREAAAKAEEIGRQELIGYFSNILAKALLLQNRSLEEALSLSRHTVEIYRRLVMPDELQWAQETVAEIERAISGKRGN
jgi:tetratricopeptide (TPR) repeat protein